MTAPGQYLQRPITVTAAQWDGTETSAAEIMLWIRTNRGAASHKEGRPIRIEGLVASVSALPGDFVILGPTGAFHVQRADEFERCYGPVTCPSQAVLPGETYSCSLPGGHPEPHSWEYPNLYPEPDAVPGDGRERDHGNAL